MDRNSVRPMHVAILLLGFWSVWLYTEIQEYRVSARKWQEIESFMQIGNRFTQEEGDALQAQIFEIERKLLIHHKLQSRKTEGEDHD